MIAKKQDSDEELTITHASVNLSSEVGDTEGFLVAVPIIPAGVDGHIHYARSRGDEDSRDAVGVTLKPLRGDLLRFRAGDLTVRLKDVDKHAADHAGYRLVANTVWTWVTWTDSIDEGLARYFLAAARRLDIAGVGRAELLEVLSRIETRELTGVPLRDGVFQVITKAEMSVVALYRALQMIVDIPGHFGLRASIPDEVRDRLEIIKRMRDAYEHVEERARGLVRGKPNPVALSVFDYRSLIDECRLQYADASLELRSEMLIVLGAARTCLLEMITESCGAAKTITKEITFFDAESSPTA